jgi:hypothetical protein
VAVRTKQLASGRMVDAVLTTVYNVPVGETAIVKHIDACNLSNSATAKVTLAMDVTGFDRTLFHEETLAARGSLHLDTWLVLPPGAEIAVQGPGTPAINFWISGTELEGVAD